MRLASIALPLILLAAPTGAAVPAESGNECDRLAASPYDLAFDGMGEGVASTEQIDAVSAVPACEAAVRDHSYEPRFRYQLGRAYVAAERFGEAQAAYKAAAEAGYARGWVGLGALYERGQGVPQDYAAALAHYERAVEAGDQGAHAEIGYLYETGSGVEQDYAAAAEHYQVAADAGDPWAAAELGWLYENGWGVELDLATAASLYRTGADAGEDFAQNNLATFYWHGQAGLPVDVPQAVLLYSAAVENGWLLSAWNLGMIYADGAPGVERDAAAAERYYRMAMAAEDDPALVLSATNSLAWLLAQEGTRLDEALMLAETAVAGVPEGDVEEGNYSDTLAAVLTALGRHEEALAPAQHAVEADAAFAPFHEHLGDVLAALGRETEAEKAWRAALDAPEGQDQIDRAAVEAKLAGGTPAAPADDAGGDTAG